MINENYKYSDITAKILGSAFEVHKILGNGFQELVYQRALQEEFKIQDIGFLREFEMPISYKNKQIATRRVDFLVENVVSVELKAIIKLEEVNLTQAINYLEAYHLEIGTLLNFGSKRLEYKRLINSKFKQLSEQAIKRSK